MQKEKQLFNQDGDNVSNKELRNQNEYIYTLSSLNKRHGEFKKM